MKAPAFWVFKKMLLINTINYAQVLNQPILILSSFEPATFIVASFRINIYNRFQWQYFKVRTEQDLDFTLFQYSPLMLIRITLALLMLL